MNDQPLNGELSPYKLAQQKYVKAYLKSRISGGQLQVNPAELLAANGLLSVELDVLKRVVTTLCEPGALEAAFTREYERVAEVAELNTKLVVTQ